MNGNSENLNELFAALAKAQAKLEAAKKDSLNPYFKSKYADLTSVWDSCRAALTENGLTVIQTIEGKDKDLFLVTWLGHSSGQYIISRAPIITQKWDIQGVGAAITYMRRYSLAAIVGVVADIDDDGEAAVDRNIRQEIRKDFISEKQVKEILEVFMDYPDYGKEALDHLKQMFGDNPWSKVPANYYERLMTGYKKKVKDE